MLSRLKKKYNNLVTDGRLTEILRGSAVALVARIAATGLTLISSILIARYYGAEAVGILALTNSVLMIITIFTVLGTNTSILRLIPEHIVKYSVSSAFHVYRRMLYLVAAVSVATGMVFLFASRTIAIQVFSKPHLSFYLALAACFVLFKSLMDLNTQAVRALLLIRTFAFMQLLPPFAMLFILLGGALFSRTPDMPVYAQLAAYSVSAVVGCWITERTFNSRMQHSDAIQPMPFSKIFSLSLPMLMTASMNIFIGQAGVILLGMLRSEREVGYYSVAVKLATLTSFVLQAINSIAAPKFSELYQSGRMDELIYVARKSAKLIFWTTAPILIILVVLGKPLLIVLFGKDFAVSYPALFLLVMGQFVNSVSGSTGYFMNMTGHEKTFRNIITAAAIINIALCLALIPPFGITGAACAGMLSISFWNLYALKYIKSIYGTTIGYVPLLRT